MLLLDTHYSWEHNIMKRTVHLHRFVHTLISHASKPQRHEVEALASFVALSDRSTQLVSRCSRGVQLKLIAVVLPKR